MQKNALGKLEILRQKNQTKALIIAATGSGKTYLSAFDVKNFKAQKMLFLVHRENILISAKQSFENIIPNKTFGLFTGNKKEKEKDYLFSTIQTMSLYFEQFEKNEFDYIIIEASGICEPIPIAQTITAANETLYSRGLPELFHLDNIICVADAARLSNEFNCGKHLLEPVEDEDSLDSLLMQQLEFCNTVILNKAETVNEDEKNEIKAVIHKLCKDAGIIEASFGQVNLEELLNTHNFDYEKAQNNIGWIHEIEEHEHHHHEHEGEALEYGISTFVWQTRKPLDLKKFTNLLNNYPNVIRTKGYVWFDNQPDSAYLFEQAGKLNSLTEDSLWIASAPKQDQIDLLKANPQLAQNWDEEYGDRINQLVFIGKNMNEEQIKRQFNDCLA